MRTYTGAIAVFTILLASLGLSAQTISISGTLIDAQTLAPVQGATATLVGKTLTTTTNAQGLFGFQNSTAAFKENAPRSFRADNITIRDGFLRIVNGSGFLKNAVVEFFDARGRCLFRETLKGADRGSQAYVLPSLAGSGAFFLRVNAGGTSIVRKLITIGGKNEVSLNFAVQNNGALAKTLAAAIDSIVISKSGYQTRTVTLSGYQAPLDSVRFFKTGASVWTEQILNGDGSINWTQYESVAAHAGDSAQRDYLLGPKYAYYHPQAESFPTLDLVGDADGWQGPNGRQPSLGVGAWRNWGNGWYCQAGQLLYAADDPNNAGVITAANGESFDYSVTNPPRDGYRVTSYDDPGYATTQGVWAKVYWQNYRGDVLYTFPVPPELSQPDWNAPKKPTAIAYPIGMGCGITEFVSFQNGLIGTFPVDVSAFQMDNRSIPWNYSVTGNVFPSVKLPAGKVPMALAETPGGEFVLAAVWDVTNHIGQVAVLAVNGRVRRSWLDGGAGGGYYNMMGTGSYMWGVPNWPSIKGLKLLGYIDLPIAAPTAIEAGTDIGWVHCGRENGVNTNQNVETLLDNQSERDTWYAGDQSIYPNYKVTAHAGYVMVASRSENKVVFVDLQPLLQYYRTMYFTTQARYDSTKNAGAAANQWPFTFDYRPAQKPVVASTIDVPSPTAVAAGLSAGNCAFFTCYYCSAVWGPWDRWRQSMNAFGGGYAYVATMDGRLLMYTVGGLNTEAAATPPALYKTITIGKNPTFITHGEGGVYKNDLWINCRGDKSIYALKSNGDQLYVLRDSRMQDPVMAENSFDQQINARYFVHVVDFTGKSVLTYTYHQDQTHDFSEPVKFGAASDPVPGHPFAYQQGEVP
ncbi:MAG: hypothetical protein PHC61_14290 [Chitinivibrionales bacterium]|nr:hypothetical protein [Chitinivibrionales bacterium]